MNYRHIQTGHEATESDKGVLNSVFPFARRSMENPPAVVLRQRAKIGHAVSALDQYSLSASVSFCVPWCLKIATRDRILWRFDWFLGVGCTETENDIG
jgi:hypothetical protein